MIREARDVGSADCERGMRAACEIEASSAIGVDGSLTSSSAGVLGTGVSAIELLSGVEGFVSTGVT